MMHVQWNLKPVSFIKKCKLLFCRGMAEIELTTTSATTAGNEDVESNYYEQAPPFTKTNHIFTIFICFCSLFFVVAQYIPYLALYADHQVYLPKLRSDDHMGDAIYLILLVLVASAQCFAAAQPFLLVVLLVNVFSVDLPWQLTLVFTGARELNPYGGTAQPLLVSQLHLGLGVVRFLLDVILALGILYQLRNCRGRLFVHLATDGLDWCTSTLITMCGISGCVNQLPTLVAVFLVQYFYASCEETLVVRESEKRFPLMSYFYSIFLLLISGITSRIESKVLTYLAIGSCLSIGFFGELTAFLDSAILAHEEQAAGCQGSFHVFAAIIYAIVFIGTLFTSILLYIQRQKLKFRNRKELIEEK